MGQAISHVSDSVDATVIDLTLNDLWFLAALAVWRGGGVSLRIVDEWNSTYFHCAPIGVNYLQNRWKLFE
jgi:hypothetical protein